MFVTCSPFQSCFFLVYKIKKFHFTHISYLCNLKKLDKEKKWSSPFPNDKILEMTKLKAFTDDKLNIAKMIISLFDRVENTVGKGVNAGYQHFLLSPQCFPKPCSYRLLKVETAC